MEEVYMSIVFGAFGGFVRALLGVLKALEKGKSVRYRYFTLTLLTGILSGVVAGSLVSGPQFAFIAGYAGSDFLEGLYKGFIRRTR